MPYTPDTCEPPLILMVGNVPEATEGLLREAGCRVRLAGTMASALRLAGERPRPRLVLLADVVGENYGLELLSRLLDEPGMRGVPVLYMGGGDEELALALGAADCLSLPLRPLVLLARVQAQLRLQRLNELAETGVAA